MACTYSTSAQNKSPNNIFAGIKNLPPEKRVAEARELSKTYCRKMPEAEAMRNLDTLDAIARDLNDLPLECAVFDMRADYYSVNRGFNPLSTKYYQAAEQFAEDHGLALEEAIYTHRLGVYYLIYKKNIEACRYFLFAQDKFREIGYNNVPDMAGYFIQAADFYYAIGDYENVRQNLLQALTYDKSGARTKINVLNTLGLTYRNSGAVGLAMQYFNQSLALAEAKRDSVWIGITKGNIGSIYFIQKKYDKALPLIQNDYEVSLRYNQMLNAGIAMLRLVRINLEGGNLQLAGQQLATADTLLAKAREDALNYRVEFYELKARLSERLGNIAESNLFNKKYNAAKDSLERRDNVAAVERVRLQWELEKNKAQLSEIKTNAAIGAYKRNMVIVTLALLIVIGGLIFNRQRLKTKKDKEIAASEQLRLNEELKNATLELHGYTESLVQKNLVIDEIRQEMEKMHLQFTNEGDARELDNMMKAHIMTNESWDEFKKLFTKVHPAFFYRLRNAHPHLTDTDVRLMALLKLNLNNREMAGMLGITLDGVKKAKQRLRKKVGLDAGGEIEDIVDKL
ncbi:helix-turn-helix transcriptional regulator [Mucilaginibacter pedocola]|nr:hypothetical protein [Mucilaginibacter pedocola]